MRPVTLLFLVLTAPVWAEYNCACNFNEEASVYGSPGLSGSPIGYMYELDCKPVYSDPSPSAPISIQFKKQLGYLRPGPQLKLQKCPGDPSTDDLVRRFTMAPTTTTTTTTLRPTTTPPKRTTTSTTTTTPKPTTTASITEGRIDLCPAYITTDATRNGGFIGQFGRYCYELVDTPTQWDIAERHCKLASSAHLLYIMSQDEQDYVVQLLNTHQYIQEIWIGLNDKEHEGTLAWSSGVNVSYTNFGREYNSHSYYTHTLNDCGVFRPGGEWTDLPCGVQIIAGVGLFDKHSYVCKHQINSTMFNLIDNPGSAFVG